MDKFFTVYDSKAEAYMRPFVQTSAGVALRDFETAINTKGSPFNLYPGDYTLFEIGTFDEQTADIEKLKTPINLAVGHTLLQTQSPPLRAITGGE